MLAAKNGVFDQARSEQHIEVTFDDRKPGVPAPGSTPETPGEISPPGPAGGSDQARPVA